MSERPQQSVGDMARDYYVRHGIDERHLAEGAQNLQNLEAAVVEEARAAGPELLTDEYRKGRVTKVANELAEATKWQSRRQVGAKVGDIAAKVFAESQQGPLIDDALVEAARPHAKGGIDPKLERELGPVNLMSQQEAQRWAGLPRSAEHPRQ